VDERRDAAVDASGSAADGAGSTIDDAEPSVRGRLPAALRRRIGIDVRALAAFRIALGAVLLVDLALRAGT